MDAERRRNRELTGRSRTLDLIVESTEGLTTARTDRVLRFDTGMPLTVNEKALLR